MLILRRTAARRIVAAAALATALSVFVTPLASIQHEANVRHILCLEHGELIDAAPLSASELAAPAHHHARTVLERSHQTPAAIGDAHCLLAAWHHQRSTPAQDARVIAPQQPVIGQLAPQAPDRRSAAIALYRLAPKLSPPLA